MNPRTRSRTAELVAGAISAMLAFAALYGIVLIASYLSGRESLPELRAERAAATNWPVVEGTLERLTVSASRSGRGQGRIYGAEADYRYEVGGKAYAGTRIGFDWHVSHSNEWPDFRERVAAFAPGVDLRTFLDSPACASLGAYESCSHSYTPATPLRVRHDPADPSRAVLESRDLVPVSALEHWGEPLAWLAVLLAFALACSLSTWLMLRSSSLPAAPLLSARTTSFWAIALGMLFLAIPFEYYLANLAWRGALDDSGRSLAWGVALALMLPFGVLGLFLLFQGVRALARPPLESDIQSR